MKLYKYAITDTIYFSLYNANGLGLKKNASFEAGDVKISIDGASETNTTNLPIISGQGYVLTLTSLELTGKKIRLYIVDQTGTQEWLDLSIEIFTFGNALAQVPFNFGLDVIDNVIETGYTLKDVIQVMSAILVGKTSGGSGLTYTFRNLLDSKNRAVVTVDSNKNRTSVAITKDS